MISEEKMPQDIIDEGNKKEDPSLNIEKSLPEAENTERQPEESQLSYLQRAGEAVTKKQKESFGVFFDPGRSQEERLPQDIISMIKNITVEALKPQESFVNSFKNEEVIKDIKGKIGYHDIGKFADSDSFDKTQRGRKFFEIQPGEKKGGAKRETYWNTLFFPYNTKATREFAKKILNDKTIVLLGGGRSQLKKELNENNITPREVVNVDPFVENVKEGADKVVPLSASENGFVDKVKKEGITGVDEIWAEYSVPAYLEDPKEIQQLIQNIDALLVEGGTARIWPIEVCGRGEDKDRVLRKDALLDSIKKINATGKYEIVLQESVGRNGLTLHKLPPSREKLQKKDDEEKIREIRNEIKLNF
jgi:hypothetical protein